MERRRPMEKLLQFRFPTSTLSQLLDPRTRPLFLTRARAETLVTRRTAARSPIPLRTSEPEPRSTREPDKFLVNLVHILVHKYVHIFLFQLYLLNLPTHIFFTF